MKDNGILVLGETSGGGSCSVQFRLTAEGLPYGMSSEIMMINSKGENIDAGSEDYSDMYDFARISAAFREFYGIEEDEPSEPAEADTNPSTGAAVPAVAAAAAVVILCAAVAVRKKRD